MGLKKWLFSIADRIKLLRGVKNRRDLRNLLDKKPLEELLWLTLSRDDVKFAVSSREQVMSMKVCLIDRVYTRHAGGIGKDWTIVDVGAAIGGFTIEAARIATEGRVIALEPNMGSINVLRQNVRANQLQNVEALNLGVWDRDAEMPLCISEQHPLQAQTNETEKNSESEARETMVPVISLETLVNETVTDEIDLMKLDCEGAEFAFLLNKPATLFKRIKRIVMEYHNLDSERTHKQLKEYLEHVGFDVRVFVNPLDKNTGYLSAVRGEVRANSGLE